MSASIWVTAAAALAAAALAGCSDDGVDPPDNAACEVSAPPEVPVEVPGDLRGSVTILDRRDHTLDESGQPRAGVQGRIAATFADFSAITSTKSGLMPLGDTCVGTISRPLSSGELGRLELDSLVVTGLTKAEIRPTRTSPGVYTAVEASLLLDGAAQIRVTGVGAAGGFASFDETLEGIDALEVTEPASDGTAKLTVDEVFVRWNPGNGDYALVTISPKDPMNGGAVSCLVQDDGCFVLPTAAATFLLASQDDQYELSVERHRRRSVRLAEETTLDIELVAEHRATMVNGALEP